MPLPFIIGGIIAAGNAIAAAGAAGVATTVVGTAAAAGVAKVISEEIVKPPIVRPRKKDEYEIKCGYEAKEDE